MNLNSIIAKILKINLNQFEELVDGRGMRPVKAAIRLGAEPEKAQIFATLKIAKTAEEITAVYKNDKIRSCMTGDDVGPFYAANGISCIYSGNYRCLVNLKTMTLCSMGYQKGYGYHRNIITPELKNYFTGWRFITTTEIVGEEWVSSEVLKVIRTPSVKTTYSGWELKEISFNFFGESMKVSQWKLFQNEMDAISTSFLKWVREEAEFFLTNASASTARVVELVVPNLGRFPSVILTLQYGSFNYIDPAILNPIAMAMGGAHTPNVHAKLMHERKIKQETLRYEGFWFKKEKWWCIDKVITSVSVEIENTYRKVFKKYLEFFEVDKVVTPKGVLKPYLDFPLERRDVTFDVLNKNIIQLKDMEEVEDHYLNLLGDSYTERMNHPRENFSHGRKKKAA